MLRLGYFFEINGYMKNLPQNLSILHSGKKYLDDSNVLRSKKQIVLFREPKMFFFGVTVKIFWNLYVLRALV